VQTIPVIEICLAATGGAVVGAVVCRLHARRQIDRLKQRLQRSEEARNGAIERSAAARDQIGQLSKAISELRRSHQPARVVAPATPSADERRAAAERALAEASPGRRDPASDPEPPLVFANTEPMRY
jgi:hypothetical protein